MQRILTKTVLCLSIISALFLHSTANSASVSSLSGTISNNQTLTINGSGFGTKSPVAPWLYDDFESGSTGSDVRNTTTEIGAKTWNTYEYGTDSEYLTFSTIRAFNGVQAAYTEDSHSGTFSGNVWIGGMAAQTRYVSYRWYTDTGIGGTKKWDRSTANTGNGVNNAPYDACPDWGMGPDYWWYNDCSTVHDKYTGVPTTGNYNDPSTGAWHRIETWIEVSSPNTSDGTYLGWTDLVDSFLTADAIGNIPNCEGVSGCQVDTWMTLLIANNTATYRWWYDCIYIDYTRKRIEIGDNATFTSCTDRVIQVPQNTWSDGQVEIKVKTGGQTGTKYLFIVDSDGSPIDLNGASTGEGYEITMGSTYGGSPPSGRFSTVEYSAGGMRVGD